MSSILREALAVFASSWHLCAKKKLKRLAKERQAWDSPAKHAVEQWVPHYNPQGPSTGCQIVCNANITGITESNIYPAFFAQPGSEAANEPQTVCLAQIKTRSVPLPRKYGTQPKQNSPGWSLGCATALLTGQTGAISNRYNGEWAKDTQFRSTRQAFNCLALVSICYWRPLWHEMMVSLQFLVSACQHHYHSEHPSSWSYQRSQGLSGKKG